MSNPIPSQIALATIANGTLADGSVVQSNDVAIQAAVNALIVALSNGTTGQFLQAVDASDVKWGAGADLAATGLQTFAGPLSLTALELPLGANLTISAGAITNGTNSFHTITSNDGTTVTTITNANVTSSNGLLLLYNNTATNAAFGTGGNINYAFTIPTSGAALLLWGGSAWILLVVTGTTPQRAAKKVLVYGATVTPDASAPLNLLTVTNGTAFTIANPINPPSANETQSFSLEIFNNSGGAHGAITLGAAYLNSVAPTVPSAKRHLMVFVWNGTGWVENQGTASY